MVSSDPHSQLLMKLRIVLLAMLMAFVFLGSALWRVQILNASEYRSSLNRQSVRSARLPGRRGRIFDRNGVILADNRPSYCVAIYVEELRQPGRISRTVDRVEEAVRQLAGILDTPPEVTRADIKNHVIKRRPLPFLAWHDIDQKALARMSEGRATFPGGDGYLPGVDIYVEPRRTYPSKTLGAHVLGHVGRASEEQDDEEPYHFFYLPELAGRQGVERVMNETLRGEAGGHLIRVDASGFKHRELGKKEPIPGEDVILAMDARVQRLAEAALGGQRGAAVVLDPRNGDVLALASSPAFDPNMFSAGLVSKEWRALVKDRTRKLLLNRAVSEMYAPGSVFKPVVAIAALENRRANANTSYHCPGYYQLGNVTFKCWNRRGHGLLNMRQAIEQSCNAYFCHLGRTCGYERIFHMADAMGLGHKTGIDLVRESGGILPNEAWKRRVFKDGWRPGDTCNVSIGQGALAVTPIQMAVVTATIASKGRIYRPRVVLRHGAAPVASGMADGFMEGELIADLGWEEETVKVVHGGMFDVVQALEGTGKRAKIPGVEMAGKTGTAEYGHKGEGKKHTWMIAFAPFEKPRYAAVIVFEDGESGGRTAAPKMKELMAGILGVNIPPVVPEGTIL